MNNEFFSFFLLLHFLCPILTYSQACPSPYDHVVINEVSGDAGQSDASNDGILEIAGPVGTDIGCMVVSNSEWAIVIPSGTVIPVNGTFVIGCSEDMNYSGTGTPNTSGLSCSICDFAGLTLDFDVCDPAHAAYYDPAATGFTIDNAGATDGDQIVLFQADGTVHDAVYWGTSATTAFGATFGGASGNADNVTVALGNSYTLGTSGIKGDGGTATAVASMPPGDCNANQISYTMPGLNDPVWVEIGPNVKGCNSAYIRISNNNFEHMSTAGTLIPVNLLTPSACDAAIAATQWGQTNHPNPGEPNDALAWHFRVDQTTLCAPGAVTFTLEVYNYQNVSDNSDTRSGDDNEQMGSYVQAPATDPNAAPNGDGVQTWATYVTTDGTTSMTYTTGTLPAGSHTFTLQWDDFSNCCGSSSITSGNECYERETFTITVAAPLAYDCDGDGTTDAPQTDCAIDCSGNTPTGAINIRNYIVGGSDDLSFTLNPGGETNSTGVFMLPTDGDVNPFVVTVSDNSACGFPDLTVTINDNCEQVPLCPENYSFTANGGMATVDACPTQTIEFCFIGDDLPLGGTITIEADLLLADGITSGSDGTFETQLCVEPTPDPNCPLVVVISDLVPDGDPDECNQEIIQIRADNPCNCPAGTLIDISDWQLDDNTGGTDFGDPSHIFPAGTSLSINQSIDLSCNYSERSGFIWNNDGDDATLHDAAGNLIAMVSYSENPGVGNSIPNVPTSPTCPVANINTDVCCNFIIPVTACPASNFDFRAVVAPFDTNCPNDVDDETDAFSETIGIQVSCPDATIAANSIDVCEADRSSINIPVTINGGTGPYTVTHAIDGINQAPINISKGDNMIINGPTIGEVKVNLVSIVDQGGAACTGAVGSEEVCVNIRPSPTGEVTNNCTDIIGCAADGSEAGSVLFTFMGTGPWEFVYEVNGMEYDAIATVSPFTLSTSIPGEYALVSVADEANCVGTVDNATCTVAAPTDFPTLNVTTQPTAICNDGSGSVNLTTEVTYDIDGGNGTLSDLTFYTANPIGAGFNATTQELTNTTVSPATTTAYFATYIDGNGCSAVTEIIVTIDAAVCPAPAIMIIKEDADNSDDHQQLPTNGTATFTITVTNTGNEELCNVTITDAPSDPNLSGASCAGTLMQLGKSNNNLALGESFTYTCTMTGVTANFTNTAQVQANGCTSTIPVNDADPTTVEVLIPSILIDKEDSTPGTTDTDGNDTQTVSMNGMATFTIAVTNNGTEDLCNVMVTDLPSIMGLVVADCEQIFMGNMGAGVGILTVGATWTFTCIVTDITQNFTNTATVTAQGCLSNVSVTDNDHTTVNTLIPAITIIKDDGDNHDDTQTVPLGGTATFMITVTNSGDEDLCNIQITDTASDATLDVSSCESDLITLGETDHTLAVGESYTYTCAVNNVTTNFTNTIAVTAQGCNTAFAVQNQDTTVVNVPICNINNIKVQQNCTDNPNDTTAYELCLTFDRINTGITERFNVYIANTLVGNYAYVVYDAAVTTHGCFPIPISDFLGDASDAATNVPVIISDSNAADPMIGGLPSCQGNTTYNESFCGITAITITKDDADNHDDQQSITMNDTATFTIIVTNTGNEDLCNIQITDVASDNTLEVHNCEGNLATLGDADGILAIGETHTYTCQVNNASANYINTIAVTATGCRTGNIVVDHDSTTVTINSCPTERPDFTNAYTLCTNSLPILPIVPTDAEIEATLSNGTLNLDYTFEWSTDPTQSIIYTGDGCSPQLFTYTLTLRCLNDPTTTLNGGTISVTVYPIPIVTTSIDNCLPGVSTNCPNAILIYDNDGPDGVYESTIPPVPVLDGEVTVYYNIILPNQPTNCMITGEYVSTCICDITYDITLYSNGDQGGVTPFFYNEGLVRVYSPYTPYTFDWEVAQYVRHKTRPDYDNDRINIEILYDDYAVWTITVTDAIGCQIIATNNPKGTGETVEILDIYEYQLTPATGYTGNDGKIELFIEGGCPPYDYTWHGPFLWTSSGTVMNGERVAIDSLHHGWYWITITDSGDPNGSGIYAPDEIPQAPNDICMNQQVTTGWYWVPWNATPSDGDGWIRGKGVNQTTSFIQVAPNPFINTTNITFTSNITTDHATLDLYYLNGQKVMTLFKGTVEAGINYELPFEASPLVAGIYMIQLVTENGVSSSTKLVIIK